MSAEHMDDNAAAELVVTLEPIEPEVAKEPGEDEGIIETFRGKKNRVRLGRPHYHNYVAQLLGNGQQLPADIEQHVRKGYDFQRVTTSLTLLPDTGCAFLAVDLAIELIAVSSGEGEVPTERPIAYEVKPQEVVHEIPYRQLSKIGYEVGGGAQVGLSNILAKLTKENAFEQNGVWYVRELYGYGVNFSEAGWRLQASAHRELSGDVRNLELIVQIPKGARLNGRFHVATEVAVAVSLDRWLTRAFGPRPNDPVLEVVYALSD